MSLCLAIFVTSLLFLEILRIKKSHQKNSKKVYWALLTERVELFISLWVFKNLHFLVIVQCEGAFPNLSAFNQNHRFSYRVSANFETKQKNPLLNFDVSIISTFHEDWRKRFQILRNTNKPRQQWFMHQAIVLKISTLFIFSCLIIPLFSIQLICNWK